MASFASAKGLTAGLQLSRQLLDTQEKRRNKRKKNHFALVFISSLAVAFILLSLFIQSRGEEESVNGDKSSITPLDNGYEMKVYALNDTMRSPLSFGTLFTFDAHELPFEFGSLRFGDPREDTEYSSRYYAGMGFLANASGSNASLIFWEGNGNLIQEVAYQGQSLIALGGWESNSTDNTGSVMNQSWGSMAIPAHDWKDGSWVPEDGILIEHPANVTISKATIDLIVFEPTSNTDIPEFTPLHVSILAAFLILLARRRVTKQACINVDCATTGTFA